MNLFEAFGIHWKILLGQVINFLVLLFLLNKFAYKPFFKILKERREKIKTGIEKETEAKKKLEEIEKQKLEILNKAKQEAELILKETEKIGKEEMEKILKKAEEEKKRILEEGKNLAQIEIEKMKTDFSQKNLELISVLAEKILREKIDLEKDKEIIEKFLK